MTKPKRMEINFDGIPVELLQQKKWIVWKWEKRNGKWTKPPYQINGKQAKSNDTATWFTFNEVTKAMQSGKYDGVGYMLSSNDPYCGFDFDESLNFLGELRDWVRAPLDRLNSYSEVSPSGKGIKTLTKGELPGPGHHNEKIGVFDHGRYFCITGHVVDGFSPNIESRQVEVNDFIREHWPEDFERPEKVTKQKTPQTTLEDNEVIDKALASKSGEKFLALMNGKWQGDYSSQSEADLALCCKLVFWCGNKPKQIDRIFRRSGLYRDKWERKDYRERTIRASIQKTEETYKGAKKDTAKRVLIQALRDWISTTKGEFYTNEVFEILNISRHQKAQVSRTLSTLISEGLIERTGRRTGCFRRIEKTLHKMDLFNTKVETVDITLPFYINDMVKIMPGNVIVVAGAKDSGKTTFLLNVAADNKEKSDIHYFNSEMGQGELILRLKLFDNVPFEDWGRVSFYERDENFSDVIVPGKGVINIIDFLELYEDFWLVRKRIAEIWRKLDGAIAIIALQKPAGRDTAFGGEGSLEKARLALSINPGTLKIISAKNWKGPENPRGKEIDFKLVQGSKLIQTD